MGLHFPPKILKTHKDQTKEVNLTSFLLIIQQPNIGNHKNNSNIIMEPYSSFWKILTYHFLGKNGNQWDSLPLFKVILQLFLEKW